MPPKNSTQQVLKRHMTAVDSSDIDAILVGYDHKQPSSIFSRSLFVAGLVVAPMMLVAMWGLFPDPIFVMVGFVFSCLILGYIACHLSLRVRDEGDCLVLRFGPIPLFFKRFWYVETTAVEPSRFTIFDGWGVYYRGYTSLWGWTYSVGGFGFVKVQMGRQTVRIGTDDVEGLVAFLRTKIAEPTP